ncbi:hypothetical protein PGTUg99_004211 [Puccinia graminis f. sp. tritici]|uniref:CxC1-like cysteine cluster associated with KDZ transposases domain-containing protein n=1 Tax=Puccinia graminis f. sp. tritici TaxID=56615 RepID=A0A5B0S2J8_PUCGR|nr:hypothetical protein PGTUg99_004211 [Puccinia graminis f. sp. tritici]
MRYTVPIAFSGSRANNLRQKAYAASNAAMLARHRARQQAARRQADQVAVSEPLDQDEILEPAYDHEIPPDNTPDDQTEDEDNQWVTLTEEPPPNPIDEAIASRMEAHRRKARLFNSSVVLRLLHPIYIALKHKTQNWAGPEAANSFVNCRCLPHTLTKRYVDLVDIIGQHRVKLSFCRCTPDAVRLMQQGYLAGSPMQPQTAFSMRLMIFHNDLWNHCHVGTMPFTLALQDWLEPRTGRLFAKNSKNFPSVQARDLRKPFSAAIDMYRELNDMSHNMIMSSLQLTEQQQLASVSCPACFGPQPPNANQYPTATRDSLILCLDGNFQHRHHSKASRDETIRAHRFFLQQNEVENMKAEIRLKELEHKPPAQADRCADAHKAADDKRNELTWKGCDDTGLMGCCCRHDSVVYVANIYKSGEQRSLPCALIKKVLTAIEPNRQVGVLYDIGCSLNKFISIRNLFGSDRSRIKFATSIFHAYVHNWMCQLEYNPRYNVGWGLSDGEGLERMWAYLSPLVSPLRYATRNHRLAAISHRLKYHNFRGNNQLALWLKRKFNNAVKRRQETRTILGGLLDQTNRHEHNGGVFTTNFFKRQWKDQRQFQADHTEEENDRKLRLVKLYKDEEVLDLLRNRLMGPEVFLATEQQVSELLDTIAKKTETLKKEAEELYRSYSTAEGTQRNDEERLLLLLWDAKSELFVHAVHLHAEYQPIINSRTIGARLGTKLKEKIFKAIKARRPAIQRSIDNFNQCSKNFIAKFPDQAPSGFQGDLSYEVFEALPLDDLFWNNGFYFHSKAPWAVDPDVRTGINCILILSRIQEEFQLIAQELARAVGWAVAHYDHLTKFIVYLLDRHNLLKRLNKSEPRVSIKEQLRLVPLDHIDQMHLGGVGRLLKMKMVRYELESRLLLHETLVEQWSNDIVWLWDRCQLLPNKPHITQWHDLLRRIHLHKQGSADEVNGVDEHLEEAVLEEGALDGEDADDKWINETDAAGVEADAGDARGL